MRLREQAGIDGQGLPGVDTRFMDDGGDASRIVLARIAQQGAQHTVAGPEGTYDRYDVAASSHNDAGLIDVPHAHIEGAVWHDVDADGTQNEVTAWKDDVDSGAPDGADDPGVNGIEAVLDRYVVQDGAWSFDGEVARMDTATGMDASIGVEHEGV